MGETTLDTRKKTYLVSEVDSLEAFGFDVSASLSESSIYVNLDAFLRRNISVCIINVSKQTRLKIKSEYLPQVLGGSV
jgi:hypothetical protein